MAPGAAAGAIGGRLPAAAGFGQRLGVLAAFAAGDSEALENPALRGVFSDSGEPSIEFPRGKPGESF